MIHPTSPTHISILMEGLSRPHQFRGTTSIDDNLDETARNLLDGAKNDNMDGRYFSFDDPAAGAAYGRDTILIEVDIDPADLIYENAPEIVVLNDRTFDNGVPENEIKKGVESLRKQGVPANLIERFVELARTRNELASNDKNPIHHYDGKTSSEVSEFSRTLSQYLIGPGSQVTLHHRPVKFSELVAIYRIHYENPELRKLSDEARKVVRNNQELAKQMGLYRRDISNEQREVIRAEYRAKCQQYDEIQIGKKWSQLTQQNKCQYIVGTIYYNRGDATFNVGSIIQ